MCVCTQVVWLIQVPRVFDVWRKLGKVKSLEQMLDNIFRPLFEVSLDPSSDPVLHDFLKTVVGLDSVDDESVFDPLTSDVEADAWTEAEKPPYSTMLYYMYANLISLNELRASKGLNTFALRPHCGESGAAHHLATAFLLADGISHGIVLDQ